MNHLNRLLYLFLILTSVACSKNSSDSTTTGTSVSIPSIQPPVSKATPVGLKGASSLMSYSTGEISTLSLAYTDLQQRFYGAGPTKIDNLLSAVDSRMSGINSRSSQDTHACLNATPVEYSMSILGTINKCVG